MTERNYFMGFNSYESKYNIHFASGNETDPISILENLRKTWNKNGYSEDYGDLGVVVIDLDNDKEKAKLLADLINDNQDVLFIISNPCIETWFLFHFEENPKRLVHSKDVVKELSKYINGYDKSLNYNRILYAKTNVAIRNSQNKEKQLASLYEWPDVKCNPRSDIHKLINIIR